MFGIRGISGWTSACSSPCTVTSKPADRERVAVAHHVHPLPSPSSWPATDRLVHTSSAGSASSAARSRSRLEVVGVLVRDQDGGGAVERRRFGERARVDDEPAVAVAEDDAGVARAWSAP